MRNLKRALSLALASVMVMGLMVVGSGASYKDVSSENNQEAIEVLQEVGIMVGDENGNFNPDANVTRNEMAVIMSNLMDYRVASYKGTSPFTDVPSWAEPYVAACWTNGITSGMSATIYGGDQTVTTAQAALMLMKALGYFQYQSDFGDDWQLATVSQANKIDLFEDVSSGVKEAMTRNDVAQLVLNTLESGTVEADDDTIKVDTGDVKVEAGKVKYNFITSGKDYATAINDDLYTGNSGEYSNGSIVELGEKLYQGDLTKTKGTDDFNAPANVWDYQSKEIGKYADKADYTFTAKVTSKALYNAIGKTAANYKNWAVSVNGEYIDYEGSDLLKNKSDDDKDFAAKAGLDAATGNGVLTKVFVDGSDKTVDIAIIYYYAAEVLKVDEDEGTITLSALYGPAETDDEFDSTDFEEDDIVIYSYANDEIQSVQAAALMEGEVTRVRTGTTSGTEGDGDNFSVDGTTYKYNATMDSEDRLLTENVNNDVVAYLDAYGYVAYIDESAVTYDYAYVLSMGTDSDQYGEDAKGKTVYARLVLTDGTMVKVETDAKANEEEIGELNNHIVAYSVDKNGVYTLDAKSGEIDTVNDALKVENGVASFDVKANTRYTANSNTIFVVCDPDPDSYNDYDFTVYTGVKNVPDIDGKTGTKVAVATDKTNSKLAKVVYIEDSDVAGTDDVIFVKANPNAKLVKDTDIGNYYEISAVVGGKVTTLNVKQNTAAANTLVKNATGVKIVALKSVSKNSDELVTSVRAYSAYNSDSGDGVLNADYITGTAKAEKGTVGIGAPENTTYYTYAEDVLVVRYDYKGDFKLSRISSIKDDSDDLVLAVTDGDVLTGICILEQDENGNGGVTGSKVISGGDVKSSNVKTSAAIKRLAAGSYVLTAMPTEDDLKNDISGDIKENMFFVFNMEEDGAAELVILDKNGNEVWNETADGMSAGKHFFYIRVINNPEFAEGKASGEYTWGIYVDNNAIVDGTFIVK